MCGRFNLLATPGVSELLEELGVEAQLTDHCNIAPTEPVPIVFENSAFENEVFAGAPANTGNRQCHMARWWLTPSWSSGPDTRYAMFNARAENLETSRAFKGPFRHKRCLIPATSFVEWQTGEEGKQPIEIFRPSQPLVFAGLWDCWNDELLSCTIITTAAAPSVEAIHKRMPVLLDREGMLKWLAPQTPTADLHRLMQPRLPYALQARPIDKSYNSSRNKAAPRPTGDSWELSSCNNQ